MVARRQPNQLGMAAQHAGGERMEGAEPQPLDRALQDGAHIAGISRAALLVKVTEST